MELKSLPKCSVETTLALLNNKWKVLIIRDLMNGTKRFGELKQTLGKITQKVLTTNLRSMEEDGLVIRKVFSTLPPKVEYTLSDIGYSLAHVIDAMNDWGSGYKEYLKLLEKSKRHSDSL